MRVFVDTLFVVALINTRDQYHRQAVLVADRYEGQQLLTTEAVLMEIGNALSRQFKNEAAQVIEEFLTSDDVEVVSISAELFKEAFGLYRTYEDKQWGLIDCTSFIVMKNAGVSEALTFDQHFVQAGFRAVLREA